MIPKSQNSSSGNRTSESSLSESPSHSAYLDSSSEEEKPVLKTRKQDDKKAVHPKKVEKPVSASTSTEPEFKPKKIRNAQPDTESSKKSGRSIAGKPSSHGGESAPPGSSTKETKSGLAKRSSKAATPDMLSVKTKDAKRKQILSENGKRKDPATTIGRHASEARNKEKTGLGKSPARSDSVGRAIRAIEDGNFLEFQRLVPYRVPVDATSSQGRSLLAIAKFHMHQEIVDYINQKMTGRVIKAIETGDLADVKKFVPFQVQPDATSTSGRSLLKIACFHQQTAIINYLESQLDNDASNSSASGEPPSLATSAAKAKAVSVIEFYDKDKKYYQFTNFYEGEPIKIGGVSWKTAEHYYQAQKFVGKPDLQKAVRKTGTAKEARDFAQAHERDWQPGWKKVNVDIMRTVLAAKFGQSKYLRGLLCGTGSARLVEASRRDDFWGYGADGNGENMLGKLLMELRTELQEEM